MTPNQLKGEIQMTKPQVNEKILGKIQKALALAADRPTDAEAQTAMMMAQKMMAKHGLEMGDITFASEIEQDVTDETLTEYGKTQQWEKHLAVVIADNFRCTSYLNKKMQGARYGVTSLRFVGLKEDVEIAIMVYNYAHEMLTLLVKQYLKDNGVSGKRDISTAKNEYRNGFIQGLAAKFKEQVEKEGWGLIIVQADAVVEKVVDMGLRPGYRSRAKRFGDDAARSAGYDEGKKFEAGEGRLK